MNMQQVAYAAIVPALVAHAAKHSNEFRVEFDELLGYSIIGKTRDGQKHLLAEALTMHDKSIQVNTYDPQ